ncbi:MAG: fibrobacter succinogenes major paralogous domain-containing protein, partial [Flavobacteriales bacterium]
TLNEDALADSIASLEVIAARSISASSMLALYDSLRAVGSTFFCGQPYTYEGYSYATVAIGTDCWFAENLRVEKLNDGTSIPAGLNDTDWAAAVLPARTVLDEGGSNEATNAADFGLLYNWFTVTTGNLCPSGWHVPTEAEFVTIINANGGEASAGPAMKASATDTPAWDGSNTTGFTGVRSGVRDNDGTFISDKSLIWTSSNGGAKAKAFRLNNSGASTLGNEKEKGLGVRCVQD